MLNQFNPHCFHGIWSLYFVTWRENLQATHTYIFPTSITPYWFMVKSQFLQVNSSSFLVKAKSPFLQVNSPFDITFYGVNLQCSGKTKTPKFSDVPIPGGFPLFSTILFRRRRSYFPLPAPWWPWPGTSPRPWSGASGMPWRGSWRQRDRRPGCQFLGNKVTI